VAVAVLKAGGLKAGGLNAGAVACGGAHRGTPENRARSSGQRRICALIYTRIYARLPDVAHPEDSMPLDGTIQQLDAVRPAPRESRPLDPRTRLLLDAPIARTLVRLAWPN